MWRLRSWPPTKLGKVYMLPEPVAHEVYHHADVMLSRIVRAIRHEERANGAVRVQVRVERVRAARDFGVQNPRDRNRTHARSILKGDSEHVQALAKRLNATRPPWRVVGRDGESELRVPPLHRLSVAVQP